MSLPRGGHANEMTLLDWFAGLSLAGMRAGALEAGTELSSETAATYAYEDARAMVKERRNEVNRRVPLEPPPRTVTDREPARTR